MTADGQITIALAQQNLVWEDVTSNLAELGTWLQRYHHAVDMIVLPEMFTTGFSMNTELAETMNGATVNQLVNWSQEFDTLIAGSIMIGEKSGVFNRFVAIYPNGHIESYDKRHLFGLGEEDQHFTAGRSRQIFKFRGFRFFPIICYDIRFPVWCRNDLEYDVLLAVANFPAARSMAWTTLLQARAIENLCFAIGVNRTGSDPNLQYDGQSAVYDVNGVALMTLGSKPIIKSVNLNIERLRAWRQRFGFLDDRDQFSIVS